MRLHISNLGPILHRFGNIADFCAPDSTPIPLISREIIFEVFQPM